MPPVPGFIAGWDDPSKLRDAELAQLAWQVERERQAQHEQERWRQSPALPPMEKVMLNWVATAPARGVLGLLAMSGPGRRAEAEEQMRKLRPLPCSPAEEEACGAVETMLDQSVLLLGPAAAETALVRGSTLLAAREAATAATAAGRGAEFAAAEATALAGAGAVEAGESTAPRFAGLLDRFTARLNPANYEVRGLGSNFGNLRYRPKVADPAGAASRGIESTIEHDAPAFVPYSEGSSVPAQELAIQPGQQGKHIPGHPNYVAEKNRSVLTAAPEELLEHAGSGEQVGKIQIGQAGSKERVDFGKIIGEFIDESTGQRTPTTNGIIHYAKDGKVHIVPSRPNP